MKTKKYWQLGRELYEVERNLEEGVSLQDLLHFYRFYCGNLEKRYPPGALAIIQSLVLALPWEEHQKILAECRNIKEAIKKMEEALEDRNYFES